MANRKIVVRRAGTAHDHVPAHDPQGTKSNIQYKVEKLHNLTEPRVGSILPEAEVRRLISDRRAEVIVLDA